ncbi:transglutaminase domain-containing protein [bacterium]|nr:transglutaminase domain-containing protein [bacterium]
MTRTVPHRPRPLVALFALGLLLGTGAIAAETSWTFGRRDDAGIAGITGQVVERFAEKPDLAGEPAVVLLKSDVYKVDADSWLVVRNEMVRVGDPEYPDVSTRQFQLDPDADIKYREAWILRGRKVIRLDESVWKIVPGDDDRATDVIIAFPDVKEGDVLGWSLEVDNHGFWGGGYLQLADDFPVLMNRTRIQTDGKLAYKTIGEHLRRGNWSQKILEKKHGAPCDIRLVVTDIPARPRGPYAPSFLEYEPYLLVMFRGAWDKEANRWIFNVSWNEAAARGSGILEYLDEQAGYVAAETQALVAGWGTDREKADAIARFIRDEIVTVSPFEVRSQGQQPHQLLRRRQATMRGKGVLMYAMCRAAGVNVDLIAGRNQFFGPPDLANPNLAQFSDFVVRLNGLQPAWYSPAYGESAPGELPPSLRGTRGFLLEPGVGEKLRDLRRQAFENTGAHVTLFWDEYVRLVKEADFAHWVDLPGDPDASVATTAELLRHVPAENAATVQVHGTGYGELQELVNDTEEPVRMLEAYLEDRFGDVGFAVTAAEATPGETRTAKAVLAGRVDAPPLPAPAGDNWIIPAELVYGREFLAGWDPARAEPFIVRFSGDRSLIWRAPLPDGWTDARLPAPFSVVDGQFAYHCQFAVRNGDLVVTREIRLLRGLTMYSDVPPFGEKVQKVRDFERSPLVLSRR